MRCWPVLFLLLLCSCQRRAEKRPLPVSYGVRIVNACGFCGSFTEWRLTNRGLDQYEAFRELQPLVLYRIQKITQLDSVSRVLTDSAAYAVTAPEADSLFQLARVFVDDVEVATTASDSITEVVVHPDGSRSVTTPRLTDQGTLSVLVAREHRSKEASAYLGFFSADDRAKRALTRYLNYLERRFASKK